MGDDIINRLKLLYFSVWSGFGVLAPFEPVFFEALSIPKSRIGILTMMPSACSFVFAPLFGVLGDTYHIHGEVIILSLALTAISKIFELYTKSFDIMVYVVLASSICLSPLASQIDSLTLSVLPDKSEYGSMRLWGAVSYGIFSFVGGTLVSSKKFNEKMSNLDASIVFWKLFYSYVFFFFLAVLIVMFIYAIIRKDKKPEDDDKNPKETFKINEKDTFMEENFEEDQNNTSVLNEVMTLIMNPYVLAFACINFISGVAAGVIESFLFLRLKQLGGTGIVMGLSKFITCAAEVPMFHYSGFLQKRYGTWCLLTCTQFAYVIRFVYYTFATNPWSILPCELLHGVTYAMTWSVSCTYMNEISSPRCHSTMQALTDGLHRGIGYGLGAVLGGFVYEYLGAVRLFEYSGMLSAVSMVIAGISWWYSLSSIRNGYREISTNPDPMV